MERIPVELLSNIFYWATLDPNRNTCSAVTPRPFESISIADADSSSLLILSIKRTLALVCWRWNALSLPFLYEEIWIRHGAAGLADVLEESHRKCATSSTRSLGYYVSRVFLPVECNGRFEESPIGKHAQRIFRCCPDILIIIRSREFIVRSDPNECDQGSLSPTPDDDVEMKNLVRVDWGRRLECWEPGQLTLPPKFCFQSSSLQVLAIGPSNGAWSSLFGKPGGSSPSILLPNVHTLHLLSAWTSAEDLMFRAVELPSLRRLITETPLYNFDNLLALNAHRIQSMEFGKSSEFLRTRCIARVLELCENIEELFLSAFFTNYTALQYANRFNRCIRRVGIHSSPNEAMNVIDCGRGHWESNWIWWHLSRVFSVFLDSPVTSKLECIALYGTEWRDNVSNPRFVKLLGQIRDKKIRLDFEDSSVRDIISPLLSSLA